MPRLNRDGSAFTLGNPCTEGVAFRSGLLVFLVFALASCGRPSPAAPDDGRVPDASGDSCRFGSVQVGTSQGYECADGEFRMWIDNDQEPYDFITAPLGESYGDVRIEVDARFVSGEEAGAYIVCRGSQLAGDFYFLRVSSEGSVEITNYLEGDEQIARMKSLPSNSVLPGWNHIQADCVGRDLSLYLNGELVLERELEGDYYTAGDVGLGAGGGSLGFSEVRFANLQVTQP